jgi:hypothetical protein
MLNKIDGNLLMRALPKVAGHCRRLLLAEVVLCAGKLFKTQNFTTKQDYNDTELPISMSIMNIISLIVVSYMNMLRVMRVYMLSAREASLKTVEIASGLSFIYFLIYS